MGPIPPQSSPTIWRHVYAGTSLALTILVCTFIGIWVDKHWGAHPWGTLTGAMVGMAAGFYNFFKEFLHDTGHPSKRT